MRHMRTKVGNAATYCHISFYVDVITYPRLNLDAGLAHLFFKKSRMISKTDVVNE